MRGTGITTARWQTISELFAFKQRVTVSELSRHMGMTRQAVQRLADDMARDGLVEFVEVLGLNGSSPARPGLYLPELLLDGKWFLDELCSAGATVSENSKIPN